MTDTAEVTPAQAIRLNLLAQVNFDTAAAQLAIDFVEDSPLRNEIFLQQLARTRTETDIVAKTIKSIQDSKEALALFNTDNA